MNISKIRFFAMAFVIPLMGLTALADTITLKNGDRFTGSIVRSDSKSVTIKTEYAGVVTITMDAIATVTADKPVVVTTRDKKTIVGKITTDAGTTTVQPENSTAATLKTDEIQVIRSSEEQAAFEAEERKYDHPSLFQLWTGTIDVGFAFTRGNANTSTFSTALAAVRQTRRDKTTGYLASVLSRNRDNGRSLTTANVARGGLRYDRNISERVFIYGLADLERNRIQRLNLRSVAGGGFGAHVIKRDTFTFDVFGGATYNREMFSEFTRNSAEGTIGEETVYKPNPRFLFSQRFILFPNLTDTGSYRHTFDATAVTAISKRLGWQVTFSNRFLSNPPAGTKKNDQIFTTGLRYTFGQ